MKLKKLTSKSGRIIAALAIVLIVGGYLVVNETQIVAQVTNGDTTQSTENAAEPTTVAIQSASAVMSEVSAAGHIELVAESILLGLEGHRSAENRYAILFRGHPPRGEAAAVAQGVDFVHNLFIGVSGAQEIGMHGMRLPVDVHGPARCVQGLCQHLPAEYAGRVARAVSDEQVLVDALDFKQGQ